MSMILSQEEIDALTSACRAAQNAGKTARDRLTERSVRPYDFARPDKFSKEHMRVLNGINSGYAAGFASSIGMILRMPVQVDPLAVEHLSFQDYLASVPEETLHYEISLEPLTQTAIFEFNPSLAYAIIDALTGGSGIGPQDPGALTDIDRAIMARVLDTLVRKYAEAWAPYMEVAAGLKDSPRANSLGQVFGGSESVLMCGYDVSFGAANGSMTVCLPAAAVEAVLPILSSCHSSDSARKHSPAFGQALERTLNDATLACRAILGRANLTTEDVINLQEGDIIRLDAHTQSEVEFWVGDQQAFSALPGRSGSRLGVKIIREKRRDG